MDRYALNAVFSDFMMQFPKIRCMLAPAILLALFAGTAPCTRTGRARRSCALIEQLGSPDYQARETATRQLVAAGSDAIAPLTKAAEGSDVETSFRAIGILQSFADGNDGIAKPPAIEALRVLATNENPRIASAADNALTLDRLAQRAAAVVELRNLGAVISTDPYFDAFNTITLDSRWTGKTTDFERLKLVPNLQQLQIINVPLDELAIKTIGDLDSLQKLDLFGTGISTEATEKLSHDLPAAKILRRAGGLLGVRGRSGTTCIVEEVQPNSAASESGIETGDEVVRFNNQPVHNFEELTVMIGEKGAGDKVTLEIHRGETTLTKEVTLGQWKYSDWRSMDPVPIQIQIQPRQIPIHVPAIQR